MSKFSTLLLIPFLALLGACGTDEADTDHGHDHAEDDDHDHAEEAGAFVMPESGRVFFAEPVDGATVKSPFTVDFGVEGVEVKPVGVMDKNTGHHHIIVNSGVIAAGEIVPADETNIHYGEGQTETELALEPGEYTLTMQLADGAHRSYGEKFAATITITVE
jgi:Domain of unknown function (DUF4399)